MRDFVSRFGKPIVYAIVMFCGLLYLTGNTRVAFIGTLIPLVLGSLNIMTSVAYRLTALVLIVAVAVAIAPASLKQRAQTLVSETASSIK